MSFWSFDIAVLVLLVSGYFTLLERYLLAIIHTRFGPDFILFGLMQPLFDMCTLLLSESLNVYLLPIISVCVLCIGSLLLVLLCYIGLISDCIFDVVLCDSDGIIICILSCYLGLFILGIGMSSFNRFGIIASTRF